MAGKKVPIKQRLASKYRVNPETGCWEWTGNRNWGGYGTVRGENGVNRAAHRAMYEQMVGPVPDGLDLDHLCRNRACVNPAHLEPVTRLENVRRGLGPIHQTSKTHCPQGHPYEGENLYLLKDGRRDCRACRNERSRARRKAANPGWIPRECRTHCKHGHEFNARNTGVDGRGHRYCLRCAADRQLDYKARKRAA